MWSSRTSLPKIARSSHGPIVAPINAATATATAVAREGAEPEPAQSRVLTGDDQPGEPAGELRDHESDRERVRRTEQREPGEQRRDLGRRTARKRERDRATGEDRLTDQLAAGRPTDEAQRRLQRGLAPGRGRSGTTGGHKKPTEAPPARAAAVRERGFHAGDRQGQAGEAANGVVTDHR